MTFTFEYYQKQYQHIIQKLIRKFVETAPCTSTDLRIKIQNQGNLPNKYVPDIVIAVSCYAKINLRSQTRLNRDEKKHENVVHKLFTLLENRVSAVFPAPKQTETKKRGQGFCPRFWVFNFEIAAQSAGFSGSSTVYIQSPPEEPTTITRLPGRRVIVIAYCARLSL